MRACSASPKALVAGHNPNDARVVRDLLKRLGLGSIDAVADAKAAIAALKGNPPDLLVVDWGDGADTVLQAARRDGGPRIVVTMAAPTRQSIAAAAAFKVDSIVAVPFCPRDFMDRVPRLDSPPQAG